MGILGFHAPKNKAKKGGGGEGGFQEALGGVGARKNEGSLPGGRNGAKNAYGKVGAH